MRINNRFYIKNTEPINKEIEEETRMVQLPATAAIEYVAAGHFFPGCLLAGGTFGWGDFRPGGLLSGELMPVPPKCNAYTHRLGFLCLAS